MHSRNSTAAYDYKYANKEHLQAIVSAFGEMIGNYVDDGWDAYMFSVLFHQLAGSRNAQIAQMKQEIERMYNRLSTRMVRKASSPNWSGYCPIGIFVPDLPVPKSRDGKKSSIEDVSINDGLHMGGIVLANRWGRVRYSLERHFRREENNYVTGKIRSIGVKRIGNGPDTATTYTFKSLTRRSFTPDDVLVLNWGENASFRPFSTMELLRKCARRELKKTPPSRAACYEMWNKMEAGIWTPQLQKVGDI